MKICDLCKKENFWDGIQDVRTINIGIFARFCTEFGESNLYWEPYRDTLGEMNLCDDCCTKLTNEIAPFIHELREKVESIKATQGK